MKVVAMQLGSCAVVRHTKEEQKERGIKEFEAVFWDLEEGGFQSLIDCDTVEEAREFLNVIDWDFDCYEPDEILSVSGLIRDWRKQ